MASPLESTKYGTLLVYRIQNNPRSGLINEWL
jgi:hypothetical protein